MVAQKGNCIQTGREGGGCRSNSVTRPFSTFRPLIEYFNFVGEQKNVKPVIAVSAVKHLSGDGRMYPRWDDKIETAFGDLNALWVAMAHRNLLDDNQRK